MTATEAALRDRIADLEEQVAYLESELGIAVEATVVDDLRLRFGLTPQQATLVRVLLGAYPKAVSRLVLADHIPPRWRKEDDDSNWLDVHVAHVRAKLGHGLITAVRRFGYRLTPEGHALLTAPKLGQAA